MSRLGEHQDCAHWPHEGPPPTATIHVAIPKLGHQNPPAIGSAQAGHIVADPTISAIHRRSPLFLPPPPPFVTTTYRFYYYPVWSSLPPRLLKTQFTAKPPQPQPSRVPLAPTRANHPSTAPARHPSFPPLYAARVVPNNSIPTKASNERARQRRLAHSNAVEARPRVPGRGGEASLSRMAGTEASTGSSGPDLLKRATQALMSK